MQEWPETNPAYPISFSIQFSILPFVIIIKPQEALSRIFLKNFRTESFPVYDYNGRQALNSKPGRGRKKRDNMKKIIAAIVALTMIGVPALATTNMNMGLWGSGYTDFKEFTTVAGFDGSEGGSPQVTGYINENIVNTGDITILKSMQNPGEWNMHEYKYVTGSGDTEINKEVSWWTEHDSTGWTPWVQPGYNPEPDEMSYPTQAHIYIGFNDMTLPGNSFTTQIDNIANQNIEGPDGEFSHSNFVMNLNTDHEFVYEQSVGINMPNDCTFHELHGWDVPFCPNCD